MMTVYIMNLKNITHGQVSAVKKITIKDGHAFSRSLRIYLLVCQLNTSHARFWLYASKNFKNKLIL